MRISSQINYSIVIAISVIMIITGIFSYYEEKDSLYKTTTQNSDLLLERLRNNLVWPVWSYNNEEIASVVNTEMKNQFVISIAVYDENGKLSVYYYKDHDDIIRSNTEEIVVTKLPYEVSRIQTKIHLNDLEIGKISVYITEKFMKSTLQRVFFGIILQIILISITLIILLHVLLNRIVILPLIKYCHLIHCFKESNFTIRSDYSGNNELGILSDTFNEMADTIQHYSEDMETIVETRTKELTTANKQLLEMNQKMKEELLMAKKIQEAIIPENLAKITELDAAGFYQPVETLGGDYYDILKLSDDKFAFVIADVCGHGVPAAMVTTMAKISFQKNIRQCTNPKEVIQSVNSDLCHVIGNMEYLTAFYGELDLYTKTLSYTNAALTEVLLFLKNGEYIGLKPNSSVIGYKKEIPFKTDQIDMKEVNKIILYTDGIIEHRKGETMYGQERLISIIKEHQNSCTQDIVNEIISDLNRFSPLEKALDDITLFILTLPS